MDLLVLIWVLMIFSLDLLVSTWADSLQFGGSTPSTVCRPAALDIKCVPLTDEESQRSWRLITQLNEKDSDCVILATSGRLILGTSESYVLAAAQLNVIWIFTPVVDRKSFANLRTVQTEISGGFLC